jgi:tyrosine-protein kinase Etk/Wzc
MIQKSSFIINKEFNPQLLRSVVRRFWYWPILFIFCFVGLAFFYLRYTKSIYESSTVIQIENTDQGKEILAVENINSKNNISSEVELMRSQFLFEKAIDKLNMNVSLFSKGKILTEEMYHMSSFNVMPFELKDSALCGLPVYIRYENGLVKLNYTFQGQNFGASGKLESHIQSKHFDVVFKAVDLHAFANSSKENQLYFIFNERASLTQRLLPNLTILPIDVAAKTIQISYRGYNPMLCNDIVQAVSTAFFEYDEELKKKSSDNILQFIDLQLDSLSHELKNSKDSLTQFQRNSNLPDPEGISSSINENINRLRDQLYEIDEELSTLRLVSSKLKADPNRLEIYKLLPEMLGKSYESSLSKQIQDLHELLERKEDLLFEVTPENGEIKALNQKISVKIQAIRRSMGVIQERLLDNSNSLQQKINGFEGQYFQLPEKKMEFNRLKSLQELNEKYYTLLTEKKVLYSISNAGYAPTNRVLSKPFIPDTPVSPNRKLIYGAFFFFGFFLGIIVIILKYLTFNEINNIEELKKLLPERVSILGSVPNMKKSMEYSQLVVNDSPKSMIAEAMRSIRANMGFINKDGKTIAISSSVSGEGKTFVALNLAGIIAMSGKKTIILDLDLRKPKIHLGFGVPNVNGISNLIIKRVSLSECIQKSEINHLDFITAGPVPPNPSELILGNSFQEILEELKLLYDVIIIDNPPVGLVSDGIHVLANADIPIYIFKAHYSKRIFSERVQELFEIQQLKSLNVILNGVDSTRSGYGYGYGYGSGYYEEETPTRVSRIKSWFKHENK